MVQSLLKQQKEHLEHFFAAIDLKKFQQIIETCLACKGTIVFSGVGKSGIIANKLAMTLLSTGSKSLFLPPMDALHGDIGLLSAEDIFICLSKSGNTEELIKLFPFVRKKGAKILGVVCSSSSKIATLADDFIELPLIRELCPYNLAPTTSTVLQLIFGDILAISLMQKKNFSLDQYALNHPAGSIGKKIALCVKDLMLKGKDIPLCQPDKKIVEILPDLSSKKCGAIIVVDDNQKLLGIFTDGDLRRAIEKYQDHFLHKSIESLMTKNPKWIQEDSLAHVALKTMEEDPYKPVSVLPVIDREKVIGIIRMHDLIQAGIKDS